MATKPRVIYTGPRSFPATSLQALGDALERAFSALESTVRKLADGGPRRWEFTDTIRATAILRPNVGLELDTQSAPAIVVTLPPHDPRDIGLECCIIRLYGTGTVTLFPIDGATLDGSAASQTLPASAGSYVVIISPRGYWLRR
jgi:hypothetical protein